MPEQSHGEERRGQEDVDDLIFRGEPQTGTSDR